MCMIFLYNFWSLLANILFWGLSSLSRDGILAPCSGSTESQPLDHQGISCNYLFSILSYSLFLRPVGLSVLYGLVLNHRFNIFNG